MGSSVELGMPVLDPSPERKGFDEPRGPFKGSSPRASPRGDKGPEAGDPDYSPEPSPVDVIVAFLQLLDSPATPCLADLEHAAQAVNMHLEKAPINRAVTLENDLYITPFGIPQDKGPDDLPDVSPLDHIQQMPTFSGMPRAALAWEKAPTLPLVSSQLRIARAEPPGGGINTFVTFRNIPAQGFRSFLVAALLALAGAIVYAAGATRGHPQRADTAMHVVWLCAVASAIAACMVVLDQALGNDPDELGLQLLGSKAWRLHWPQETFLDISTLWHVLSGSAGVSASGEMGDLLGAKVRPVLGGTLCSYLARIPPPARTHNAAPGRQAWRLHWLWETFVGIIIFWRTLFGSGKVSAAGEMGDLIGAKVSPVFVVALVILVGFLNRHGMIAHPAGHQACVVVLWREASGLMGHSHESSGCAKPPCLGAVTSADWVHGSALLCLQVICSCEEKHTPNSVNDPSQC
jgi:hypothetical protein